MGLLLPTIMIVDGPGRLLRLARSQFTLAWFDYELMTAACLTGFQALEAAFRVLYPDAERRRSGRSSTGHEARASCPVTSRNTTRPLIASDENTRYAEALARHVKVALMHLRQAEDIAEAAGIDLDDYRAGTTAHLFREAGNHVEDLDTWAISNAWDRGADPRDLRSHWELVPGRGWLAASGLVAGP